MTNPYSGRDENARPLEPVLLHMIAESYGGADVTDLVGRMMGDVAVAWMIKPVLTVIEDQLWHMHSRGVIDWGGPGTVPSICPVRKLSVR